MFERNQDHQLKYAPGRLEYCLLALLQNTIKNQQNPGMTPLKLQAEIVKLLVDHGLIFTHRRPHIVSLGVVNHIKDESFNPLKLLSAGGFI